MRKLFPKEYWLSHLAAAAAFALLFPRGMFEKPEISVHYAYFCVALSAVSLVLFRTILFRVWVKRFYSDSFRIYAWFLAILAFCHLVFAGMNPVGWVYIAITAALWLGMAIAWWREKKKEE